MFDIVIFFVFIFMCFGLVMKCFVICLIGVGIVVENKSVWCLFGMFERIDLILLMNFMFSILFVLFMIIVFMLFKWIVWWLIWLRRCFGVFMMICGFFFNVWI